MESAKREREREREHRRVDVLSRQAVFGERVFLESTCLRIASCCEFCHTDMGEKQGLCACVCVYVCVYVCVCPSRLVCHCRIDCRARFSFRTISVVESIRVPRTSAVTSYTPSTGSDRKISERTLASIAFHHIIHFPSQLHVDRLSE